MSVRIGNTIVAGMPEKALHGIGEIFTTTDTGVIAGAVEANGGSYNLADYNSGTDSIASKLAAGTLSYVSKAEFQTQVTNTGACDSFGWDGASDTTFLVPKLNPWHVGKNAPVVGNGKGLGLTNGVWTGNPIALASVTYTPFSKDGINEGTLPTNNTKNLQNGTAGGNVIGVTTDPTKSGMIADLSETTNLRVMVQLATGATDQALETCTSVLADVSGLKDMSNVTATGKETVVGWGMPDYSAGVSLIVGTQYTADIDCYVLFSVRNVTLNSDVGFYINNLEVAKLGNNYSSSDDWAGFFISKGTNFKAVKGNGNTAIYAKYPLKGVK